MNKKHKTILKLSIKSTYTLTLLLLGYFLYNSINAGTWQYLISLIIAIAIIKLYFIPNKIFKYIDTHTTSKTRRKTRS